uniref:Uncharacterized protein n=1 Tax=Arundo donax TaxID=35708 RepID=A0A0A8YNM6_ARUDO
MDAGGRLAGTVLGSIDATSCHEAHASTGYKETVVRCGSELNYHEATPS